MPALPNMGIEAGMEEPVNIDHLFKDPVAQFLDVEILVVKGTGHWKIIWTVGTNTEGAEVYRQLHVIREVGRNHLTNWGPYTVTADAVESRKSPRILVKKLSFPQRKALEKIGAHTEVMVPDGEWGSQNWVTEVIQRAQLEGLLTPIETSRVLAEVEKYRTK